MRAVRRAVVVGRSRVMSWAAGPRGRGAAGRPRTARDHARLNLSRLDRAMTGLDAVLVPAGLTVHVNSMGVTLRAAATAARADEPVRRLHSRPRDQRGPRQRRRPAPAPRAGRRPRAGHPSRRPPAGHEPAPARRPRRQAERGRRGPGPADRRSRLRLRRVASPSKPKGDSLGESPFGLSTAHQAGRSRVTTEHSRGHAGRFRGNAGTFPWPSTSAASAGGAAALADVAAAGRTHLDPARQAYRRVLRPTLDGLHQLGGGVDLGR